MELSILDAISDYLTTGFLDPIFKCITYSGNHGYIFIFLTLLLLVNKKTRKIGVYCLVSLLIGYLITNQFLKPLTSRLRPFEYRDIVLKINRPTDYAFPSGHTTAAFAFSFVLFYIKFMIKNVKVYRYAIVYAVLMGYSRLYFYVHFPSDVLAGVFIGYISSILSIYVVDKVYNRFIKN